MPLQAGTWTVSLGGRVTSLDIIDASQANLNGTLDGVGFQKGSALWDEDAQRLMVFVNGPPRVFVGYLFTDQVNLTGVTGSIIFTLTGYVEHFNTSSPDKVSARKSVLGWYAQIGVE
jgi:hypothetical protein